MRIFYSKLDKNYIFYDIKNNPGKHPNSSFIKVLAEMLTKERFVFTSSRIDDNEDEE